jgi:hypothetical protein
MLDITNRYEIVLLFVKLQIHPVCEVNSWHRIIKSLLSVSQSVKSLKDVTSSKGIIVNVIYKLTQTNAKI